MHDDNVSLIEIVLRAQKRQRNLDGKAVILHPLMVALKGHHKE